MGSKAMIPRGSMLFGASQYRICPWDRHTAGVARRGHEAWIYNPKYDPPQTIQALPSESFGLFGLHLMRYFHSPTAAAMEKDPNYGSGTFCSPGTKTQQTVCLAGWPRMTHDGRARRQSCRDGKSRPLNPRNAVNGSKRYL